VNLTPKQEAFVKAYMETGNGTQAYRMAYDAENMKESTIRVKAFELLQNGKITERLEQVRESSQKRHDITIARLTEMLIEDRELARKVESPAAAVSAVMAIGKLHGLVVDKKEVTRKRDASDFDDDELLEIARMGRAGIAQAQASSKEPDSVH
jgi:phage terminase small subunit